MEFVRDQKKLKQNSAYCYNSKEQNEQIKFKIHEPSLLFYIFAAIVSNMANIKLFLRDKYPSAISDTVSLIHREMITF